MPWCVRIVGSALVLTTVVALSAPPASGDTLDTLQRLVKLHLKPAPLVPTKAPALLAHFDQTFTIGSGRRKGAFAWRLADYGPYGPDAIIALSRGDERSLSSALRDRRRDSYRVTGTRVRGRRAYLATRKV